jgi:energy-coupling factor transporter ATP-binding protein EcfA2
VFFGRENQVQEVAQRLAVARFVAVVGASGSGKSSFVRAGLLAAITQQTTNNGASPRVALLTPGEHPLDELTRAVGTATATRSESPQALSLSAMAHDRRPENAVVEGLSRPVPGGITMPTGPRNLLPGHARDALLRFR